MNGTSKSPDPTALTTEPVAPGNVRKEMQRIKLNEMFTGASRLVDLLDYIVNQNLSDPSRKILAKTIAEEVYGRRPDKDGDNHNIVRVDAGRLRRRLAEYYAGPGHDDPIVIHIDPGAMSRDMKSIAPNNRKQVLSRSRKCHEARLRVDFPLLSGHLWSHWSWASVLAV